MLAAGHHGDGKVLHAGRFENANEILVTSSSNFCLHACEVDGQPAGGKDPATRKAIQDEVLREYFAYTGKTTVVRG